MIFKQRRESKSHRRSLREDEKKKKESLILLLVVRGLWVFAKRRRTVVRFFYVLVSLVFVGGGCVDMKVRKLSLAFFAALFQKKNSVKIWKKCQSSFVAWWCKRAEFKRGEREVLWTTTRENQSFFFLKEFCRGEDEQKRRSFRGGRKKRVPKRWCIHEKHIIKLKWLLHYFDRALLHIAKSLFTRRRRRGYRLLRLLFPMIPKETTTRKRVKL